MTEADSFASEIIALIRRTRPQWILQIANPALVARHRNFWLKKIWADALVDSTRLHEYMATDRPARDHIIEVQKANRREVLASHFVVGDLKGLMVSRSEPTVLTSAPGWDGSPVAAWRLGLAQLVWHQLDVVGPRALLTGEDRTMLDWIEPYVDMARLRSESSSFTSMWLEEADITEVPRNWLNWAVDLVQSSAKISPGNPADAQHSAYLLDCDLFLTADARFVAALERVRRDAAFGFAATVLVSGDRSVSTATRIKAALDANA